ncbi:uncharacterized protein Z519_09349 [Cladophialophora bantiana CBS 173.52]|uniref:Protein phosphatase 4 core regulatory subunit R2 n=1 Tax=Cladophialophora bantiana (strain ATCC 10958 / CBS 173.52 / CDC B-1940 / NIH 8579) TaxID=1442370 RepID=A0A0D2HZB4_CLAB1|nr:uncharacterized protein Z519_09349 [Cladophialophora bantiana CBS 173.52]KIW89919.1 hypothetical protein Z519_09349 [Cladophialophora bantiana CBS 173.52]
MSLALDEHTLQNVASNGEMDYEKWPAIIEPLLQRLNEIVYTEFPTPRPYPTINRRAPSSPTQTQPAQIGDSNHNSQTPSTPLRTLPPVPPFPTSSATSTSHVPDSLPQSQDVAPAALNELPALLLQMLNSVTHTLRSSFSERPPHTIQRLAELILYPTKHYKTLPAWLRAIDRVVSVSSPANIFPLSETPPVVNGVNGDGGGGILWNNGDVRNGYDSNSLGSDESLGGALLTPIPWLRNGMGGGEDSGEDSGPLDSNTSTSTDGLDDSLTLSVTQGNGDLLVPERPDGAVTQGELIRMEQEAGVVPVTRNPPDTHVSGTMEENCLIDEGDVVPHARGPDLVGSVDMGRVDGQDVEIHIGSPSGEEGKERGIDANDGQTVLPRDAIPVGSTATETISKTGTGSTADSEDFEIVLKDAVEGGDVDAMQLDESRTDSENQRKQLLTEDGDIVLVDADGKTEDESNTGNPGENVGPDAVDARRVT